MTLPDYTRATQQSAAWLRTQNEANALDKRPPFQRLFVWSNRQRSALIETMMLKYPIPELYMQEGLTADLKLALFTVVDGQQRITTVLEYMADGFALDASVDATIAGRKFSQLSLDQRRTLLEYQFVVRTLPSAWGEDLLREVFARLNRGVSQLNDQELRHATYWGPFLKTMELIAADQRWEDLRIFTANDVRRMLDVEFVSELAVAFLFGHQNKKDTLEDFYVAYEESFEQMSDLLDAFDGALTAAVELLGQVRLKRWKKKSDFYTLFLLVARDPKGWTAANVSKRALQLDSFSQRVDELLSRIGANNPTEAEASGLTDDARVSAYALAVRGAASDLSARRTRERALEAWVSDSSTAIADEPQKTAARTTVAKKSLAKKSVASRSVAKKAVVGKSAAKKATRAKKGNSVRESRAQR